MNRLRDLREDRDLSQQQVADALGITRQYYQCYESGKNEIPLRHCITLAKFYNVSIDYICGLIPLPKPLNNLHVCDEKLERLIRKYAATDKKTKAIIDILLDEN